jgi:hypothetical protein
MAMHDAGPAGCVVTPDCLSACLRPFLRSLTIASSQYERGVAAVVCFIQGGALIDVLLHPGAGESKRARGLLRMLGFW